MPFEIGDEIEVAGGEYFYTRPGSKGYIVSDPKRSDTTVSVSFYSLSTELYHRKITEEHPKIWDVYIKDIVLVHDAAFSINRSSPYYKVLRKINQLERKRKDKGYAF